MRRALSRLAIVVLALSLPLRATDPGIEVGPGIDPPKRLPWSFPRQPVKTQRGVSGTVVVRALINRVGHVEETQIVSSPNKRLGKAAIGEFTQWKYAPATRDGDPVAVWWTESIELVDGSAEIADILRCEIHDFEVAPAERGAHVSLPVLLRNAFPKFTKGMYGRRGSVNLECLVDACGKVRDCRPLRSIGPEFTASAIKAVEHRVYRPATRDGKPVAIVFTIQVDFH